ncbi:MAG: ribonuclease HII [Bacteroidales bacterium]
MLQSFFRENCVEAGCDEAGRGCLAGPVFAAAVVFPPNYQHSELSDSKKLSESKRYTLRSVIEQDALAFAVGIVDNSTIDRINILQSSFLAMHRAIDNLSTVPEHILVDGNAFKQYKNIPHTCIIKGDGLYVSIAAASVLAKTYRDDYMKKIHEEFPVYNWNSNKGYPTVAHREAVLKHGTSKYHRLSFSVSNQLRLKL